MSKKSDEKRKTARFGEEPETPAKIQPFEDIVPLSNTDPELDVELLPLPDESDPAYIDVLIENTIRAFHLFQGDSLSLDYCGIQGIWRKRVVRDKRYTLRTRVIRAKRFLQEIREIERVIKDLDNTEPELPEDDVRGDVFKAQRKFDNDTKTLFTMRMKASEMRRELLNLSRTSEAEENAEGLEIVFVPVTRAEWEAMETTELHEGGEEGEIDED